jgi:alcohol dehydrogenase
MDVGSGHVKGHLGRHPRPGYTEWQGERGTLVHRAGVSAGWGGEQAELRFCSDARLAPAQEASGNLTGGGVAYAFEMAGSARALELAYRITRRGGTTVSAGLSHPQQQFSLQHLSLVAEERTLKGCYLGSAVPARDIPHYIDLYKAGRLPVDKLITHRLKLDQINEGFDRLASGEAVRQVILFD